jgi:ribulose-phosphate 3-epimerase
MIQVIPTVFARNKKEFAQRFQKLVSVSKSIQIDFMDDKFVKGKSIKLSQIPNLEKYKNNFEAHLMVKNPERYLLQLKKKGFKKIIFHIEALDAEKAIRLSEQTKQLGLKSFVALNPETNLEKILPVLAKTDGVLFLAVHPGKERQSFIPTVYKKVQALRKINKKIILQVDGGVTPKVAKKLAKLKVNFLNSGSFVSESENPFEAIKSLVPKNL